MRFIAFHITFTICLVSSIVCQQAILRTLSTASDEILQVGDSEDCNKTYHKQTMGLLSSPYYPLGYPDATNCKWTIDMQEGDRIALVVKSFSIGTADYLEITESKSDSMPQRYSMSHPPPQVIFSTGNELIVKLVSEADRMSSSNSLVEAIAKNRTFHALFEKEGCGGVVTLKEGYISVPSYIHDSQLSHECSWTILAPPNQIVLLQFIQFDLPPGSCLYNNVYIQDGDKRSGELIGSFCEESPPLNEIRSSGNVVNVLYRSRPNMLLLEQQLIPKIKLFYRVVDMCGGRIAGFSGTLSSPKRWIDGIYACNWTISVPLESLVAFKFHKLKQMSNSTIDYDSLTIYNSDVNKTILWSSDHDALSPQILTAKSNSIYVSLKSHGRASAATRLQFVASFQSKSSAQTKCQALGLTQVFTCDDGHYIDCAFKCDGVRDCLNGVDEQSCPSTKTIVDEVQKMGVDGTRTVARKLGYSVFLLCLIGVALLMALFFVTMNRLIRKKLRFRKQTFKYQHFPSASIFPPPYSEVDEESTGKFPPPYSEGVNSNSSLLHSPTGSLQYIKQDWNPTSPTGDDQHTVSTSTSCSNTEMHSVDLDEPE